MKFLYNDVYYDIIVERKKTTKNTYIRVNKDLQIKVTCNTLTFDFSIKKLINDNYDYICKMIDTQINKRKNNEGFFYLGKKYDVIYDDNIKELEFINNKVYMNSKLDIYKWYKKEALKLFKERMEYNYSRFSRNIPKPKLKIRRMTSKWGVCNIRTYDITINLELIKRDIKYLDYVIIHELTHLVYGNHSKYFWGVVEENMKDYKKYKNEMKEF